MYADRVTPFQTARRPEGSLRFIRSSHVARPTRSRLLAFVLAATAVASIGAALLGRLETDAVHLPSRPAAPAEPGLFDFQQVRQQVPPSVDTAPVEKIVSVPPAAIPLPRAPAPASAPALPAGVERFDACMPACDSRDPARAGTRSMTVAPARPGVPLPPLGVGEGVPAKSEPGFMERTFTATRDAVTGATNHVADQMKSLMGAN
ncbi:hypothetical protein [Aquabacter cavernae]|uniref:hypothetical protein n=1 Tax=Aquabacter cavernae TaxID=2496029 RepID=UPI000F8EB4C9|nr:hypothetical protein [Aquabacter cavernae]